MAALQQSLASCPFSQHLLQLLPHLPQATTVELVETSGGDYSLIADGIAVHSLEGAQAEALACFKHHGKPGHRSNHFIIGLGLGYLLQVVFEQSPGKIFVYEPNLQILRFTMENVDLSDFLASGRLNITPDPDILTQMADQRADFGEQHDILFLEGAAQAMPGELTRVIRENIIPSLERKKNSMIATLTLHHQWNAAFYDNLPYFMDTLPFGALSRRFEGKPALIVSAGPSLMENLETIRAQAGNMVVFAVGRCLKTLLEAGIIPDFAAFVDYQGPREQLMDLPVLPEATEKMSLLLGLFAEGVCFDLPYRKYLMPMENYGDFTNWLDENLFVNQPRVTTGGTVSMMCFQAARILGCSTITLVGQDLAFRGNQIYADGTQAAFGEDDTFAVHINEESRHREITQKPVKLVRVRGQSGDWLRTGPDYEIFLKHYQEIAQTMRRQQDTTRLVNASTGGAYIEGFEHISLTELAQQEAFPVLDKTLLRHPYNLPGIPDPVKSRKRLEQGIEGALTAMTEAGTTAGKTLRILTRLLQQPRLSTRQKEFSDFARLAAIFSWQIQSHPLLRYGLVKECWAVHHSYHLDDNPDQVMLINNMKIDREYFTSCIRTIDQMLEWLKEAQKRIQPSQKSESLVRTDSTPCRNLATTPQA
ncbi:MAG: motility associated factor glycosyltransferase family protein [Candidatus Melainabacteria bacterium]